MTALVGRDRQAATLRSEVERTVASHGGLVFVTGEAGIGKTALVAGAVDEAVAQGLVVVGGACLDREGGLWSFMQPLVDDEEEDEDE